MLPLTLICVALIGALVYEKRTNSRQTTAREREWALERGALLTRIQHPEFVVGPPEQVIPDEEHFTSEPDDIDLVGTIQAHDGPDD